MNLDEIIKIKNHYKDTLYNKVRIEQQTDMDYRNDTFNIPEIKKPHIPLRLGVGSRMVDAPAEQMITNNPTCDFEILSRNKGVSVDLSKLVNQTWLPSLRKENPNPFKESLKNKLGSGESYIRLAQNAKWIGGDKRGLPIIFMVPDSMVVYGSPEEDDCGWYPNCGVPNRVVVFYERQPLDVILRYPGWVRPEDKKGNKNVEWFEYHDKDIRYFEADGVPVLKGDRDGLQRNPYGFPPFVRKYSGFGRRSNDGELASLIVGDLRFNRDLIKELYIEASNISSILNLFSHRMFEVWSPGEISEDTIRNQLVFGAYEALVVQNVPEGTEHGFIDVPQPSAESFAHFQTLWSILVQRNPYISSGSPMANNARQEDKVNSKAFARYFTVLENTELEYATAIEMALAICAKVPGLRPEGITEDMLKSRFRCEVHLRAEDPVERDRMITLGQRLRQSGDMSMKSFMMTARGLTEDETKEEIAQILAEKVTLLSPEWIQITGMAAAEEAGMLGELEKLRAQGKAEAKPEEVAKTTQERIQGETQTEQGTEAGVEPNRGARNPPEAYNRGG